MLSPRLSRKPGPKVYSPSPNFFSSRMSGEQCCPIVYLSPNKKGQKCMSKLASYIQSNQSNNILNIFADNAKLRQQNEELKQKIKHLQENLNAMKRKLKQSDCNILQLANNLYSTGEEVFAKNNISKSKVRMVSHSKHKSNHQDLAIVQSIQLKQLAMNKISQFKNSKHLDQNKIVLANISNRIPDAEQLKDANKTISELRLNLDTANVNLKILQHKLLVKEQFIEKLKIRQCQKLTNKVIQLEGFTSKKIQLISSANSWFDIDASRQIDAKSIKSNLPLFQRTELGQSVNSYYNYCEQIK